jgi:hypothetical protein
MNTSVNIQNNEKVKEIKTVWTDKEANKLLSDGWTLLHGGNAHIDNLGYNVKPCFILARTQNK